MRPRLSSELALLAVAALVLARPAPVLAAPAPGPPWVVDRVRFEPTAPDSGAMTVEGVGTYRGAIEVSRGSGGLAVVDALGLEDYVKGIFEVPPEWPAEALKAQAIAARTFVLYMLGTKAKVSQAGDATICATDQCQVYKGVAGERRPNGQRWVKAVDDTAGRVLLYRGKPILAMYSSSNGGRSSAGSQPYLRAVNDPDDASSPLSHWRYSVPLATLAPVLGVPPPLILTSVATTGPGVVFQTKDPRDPTGAVSAHSMAAADFRGRATGRLPVPAGLPSALPTDRYTLATTGNQVVVDGGGWGHGVGMSAWGAYGKARRGLSASDILAFYYGGIRPSALPADQRGAEVRVDLDPGRSTVAVQAERNFRVVSGSAGTLGEVEVGRWRVEAAGGGVRVIPPPGRQEPLALKAAALEPPGPEGGGPVAAFQLSAPAVVTVRYTTPAGAAGSLPAQAVDVAPVRQALPPADAGGDYRVVLEVDGGPGRALSVPLHLDVPGPRRIVNHEVGVDPPVASSRRSSRRSALVPVAVVLVVGLGLGTLVVARRRRSRLLGSGRG